MQIRLGDKLLLHDLLFLSYSTAHNVAYLRRGSGEEIVLPLNFAEFDLGQYGVLSYIHPVNLSYDNPYMCTEVNAAKRLVNHNRTNTLCRLDLEDGFYAHGKFGLIPSNGGPTMHCSSKEWTTAQAALHLDALKGKELRLKVKVIHLLWNGSEVASVLFSNRSKSKLQLVVSSLNWPTFVPISPSLVKGIL